jgi:hypothetical protein
VTFLAPVNRLLALFLFLGMIAPVRAETIDDEGAEYLPHLLGTGHFFVIRDSSGLQWLYPRLT